MTPKQLISKANLAGVMDVSRDDLDDGYVERYIIDAGLIGIRFESSVLKTEKAVLKEFSGAFRLEGRPPATLALLREALMKDIGPGKSKGWIVAIGSVEKFAENAPHIAALRKIMDEVSLHWKKKSPSVLFRTFFMTTPQEKPAGKKSKS